VAACGLSAGLPFQQAAALFSLEISADSCRASPREHSLQISTENFQEFAGGLTLSSSILSIFCKSPRKTPRSLQGLVLSLSEATRKELDYDPHFFDRLLSSAWH